MKKVIDFIKQNYIIISILILATVLRIFNLDFQSLWMDELYTMNETDSSLSFTEVIAQINLRDGFPYLYFLGLNILFTIFGDDSVIARLPSAIFGIISVFMIYKLGKQIHSKNTGYVAALLLAINQYSIFQSQDARPYSMYLMVLIISYYFLIKFLKENTRKNAIIYGLSVGLLLNSNFFGLINGFTQGLLFLCYIIFNEKTSRKNLITYLFISYGIGLLMFTPNIYKFISVSQFTSSWIPAPTPDGLTKILNELMGSSEVLNFIFLPLFTFYIFYIFKLKETKTLKEILENKYLFSFIILSTWIFMIVFIVMLKSYLSTPLYISRYFSSTLPAIILILAISFNLIKNKIIYYSLILLTFTFTMVNTVVVNKYYTSVSKSQFREASEYITYHNKTNEPVYTNMKYWYDYYLNKNGVKTQTIEKPNFETLMKDIQSDVTLQKSFWIIDGYADALKISETQQQYLDSNFQLSESYDGLGAVVRHYIKR